MLRRVNDELVVYVVNQAKRGTAYWVIGELTLLTLDQIKRVMRNYRNGRYDRLFNPRKIELENWEKTRAKMGGAW